jgi:hypothetical protein
VRADVVFGEYLEPAEAAQQHVLGGPAPDPAQARQALDRGCVVKLVQGLQIEVTREDRLGILDDRLCLSQAEAVALELIWPNASELIGIGEGPRAIGIVGNRAAVGRHEERVLFPLIEDALASEGIERLAAELKEAEKRG